ncbi:hypothetical protein MWH25_08355 [Natroniella acetigena]|nr:hypothetical protein [Natroniella acetigena]MCK8827750.1 hypothetical protein [Natroniella acetigena]
MDDDRRTYSEQFKRETVELSFNFGVKDRDKFDLSKEVCYIYENSIGGKE